MSVQTGDTPPGPPQSVKSGESVDDTHIASIYNRMMTTFPRKEHHGLMPDDGCDPDMEILYWNADRAAKCIALLLTARIKFIRNIEDHARDNTSCKVPYLRAIADWVRSLDAVATNLLEELEPSDTATSLKQ